MDIKHVFFDINGTINCKAWWFSQILLWGLVVLTGALWHYLDWHDAIISAVATWCVFGVRLIVNLKRWRDRGKKHPVLWLFIEIIPVVGWIWAIIELGFFPGKGDRGN